MLAGYAAGSGCTNPAGKQVTTHGPDYFNQWYNKVSSADTTHHQPSL